MTKLLAFNNEASNDELKETETGILEDEKQVEKESVFIVDAHGQVIESPRDNAGNIIGGKIVIKNPILEEDSSNNGLEEGSINNGLEEGSSNNGLEEGSSNSDLEEGSSNSDLEEGSSNSGLEKSSGNSVEQTERKNESQKSRQRKSSSRQYDSEESYMKFCRQHKTAHENLMTSLDYYAHKRLQKEGILTPYFV